MAQESNAKSPDSLWHFMKQVDVTSNCDDRANIENLLTHQVTALSSIPPVNGAVLPAALNAGTQALQHRQAALLAGLQTAGKEAKAREASTSAKKDRIVMNRSSGKVKSLPSSSTW